ncbi:MAG: polyprenol monophosphomannose synthase [Elusimicrobiales bacterium]
MTEITVVLPTYNEAENIAEAVSRITAALGAAPHEIIVADDDSPDLTWRKAQELAAQYPNLKVLRRTTDRGLYPAVMDGFAAASGKYLAVMDADLQHDEKILPAMLEKARAGAGLVIASRYTEGGGISGWNTTRLLISQTANRLAGMLLKRRSTDLMSGFFIVERAAFEKARPALKPKGFKILMDILQNLPDGTVVTEAGYVFRPRTAGESKISLKVAWQAAAGLGELSMGRVNFILLLVALGLFLLAAAGKILRLAGLW